MTETSIELGMHETTAFVGVAKNSGKTTALGRWVERIHHRNEHAGLMSIGIDGESRDAILGVDKPSIYLPEGCVVVAARDALSRGSARFRYLESLGFATPLGRVYLARVIDAGEVVLGGIRHRADLVAAREAIRRAGGPTGAEEPLRVLLDGAYGRMLAADGRIAEAVVVSTGAVVGETPAEVVRETESLVDRLSLESPETAGRELADRAAEEGRALFGTDQGVEPLPEESALRGLPAARGDWPESTSRLAVPGAVTDRVLQELLRVEHGERTLIASAPASIQVTDELWSTFRESGWTVRVRHPVEVVAITANPVDPRGGGLPRRELLDALAGRWPALPVLDPCS